MAMPIVAYILLNKKPAATAGCGMGQRCLTLSVVLCRGYNGATNVELFAFYPAAEVVAILGVYYPTLGLDTLQVELLQGYLYWVALEFIVPTALFGGPTGQLLGPAAGGLLVNRSVGDWINGTLLENRR